MDDIFTHKCDLIVTPTNARTSPAIPTASLRAGISDLTNAGKTMRFIFLSNFLGIPGVSVPCGYDKDGLPIGFQFMAKWWNEELLLRMAAVSEDIFKNDRIAPKVYHAPRA